MHSSSVKLDYNENFYYRIRAISKIVHTSNLISVGTSTSLYTCTHKTLFKILPEKEIVMNYIFTVITSGIYDRITPSLRSADFKTITEIIDKS